MDMGQRMRQRRRDLGLKQEEIATRCGWENGQGRVGNYERGFRAPKREDIIALAKALEVTPEWLQWGTEPDEITPDERALVEHYRRLPEKDQSAVRWMMVRVAEAASAYKTQQGATDHPYDDDVPTNWDLFAARERIDAYEHRVEQDMKRRRASESKPQPRRQK